MSASDGSHREEVRVVEVNNVFKLRDLAINVYSRLPVPVRVLRGPSGNILPTYQP